ncbi:4873_t:CDS:2 [Dentiscutata heterogama]|uniref:4873_t:CDS:1 n=1 Tax=Dentiscutata heterogama TaxID=1316150 RepID=A0ACA9MJ81_9GLOM|nr:4873_t:CDS:2 [Dentiscutata heterogama]
MNEFNYYFHDKQYSFASTSSQALEITIPNKIISMSNIDDYFIYDDQNTYTMTSSQSQVIATSALTSSQPYKIITQFDNKSYESDDNLSDN